MGFAFKTAITVFDYTLYISEILNSWNVTPYTLDTVWENLPFRRKTFYTFNVTRFQGHVQ